ncbi:MAG: hypothetical protein EP307_07225 [Rhodobacteraceae bacterium]|nr:MAG: hypothetical protein EP307_07225 [Paracoccaceae bacterium]
MGRNVQVVFQTRYSFFGSSGWRSEASKTAEILFDPARLSRRLDLFRRMTLACLRDQTDPDFRLVVLTSTRLPEDHLARLTEACSDILGAGRAQVIPRAPGSAGQWLRRYMHRHMADVPHSAQVVLDDDDALSVDFVERTRTEAEFALTAMAPGQDCVYLSWASGLTARFNPDGGVDLMPREVPFTNLGLTLVAPTMTSRNPYMLAHKKVARRHAVRVFHDQRPWYLRAVHDLNDSRAMHGDDPLPRAAVEAVLDRFPLLRDMDLVALRAARAAE